MPVSKKRKPKKSEHRRGKSGDPSKVSPSLSNGPDQQYRLKVARLGKLVMERSGQWDSGEAVDTDAADSVLSKMMMELLNSPDQRIEVEGIGSVDSTMLGQAAMLIDSSARFQAQLMGSVNLRKLWEVGLSDEDRADYGSFEEFEQAWRNDEAMDGLR